MTEIRIEVETPRPPNFLKLKIPGPPRKRQDGFQESPTIRVGDLSDTQIEDLIASWKLELWKVVKAQRL